jgi:hypothetical protein
MKRVEGPVLKLDVGQLRMLAVRPYTIEIIISFASGHNAECTGTVSASRSAGGGSWTAKNRKRQCA